jgi:hypothetical protein
MNITLAIDDQVAQRAREAARLMGKSLNQAVREHLEQLAGTAQRTQRWQEFESASLQSGVRLQGWTFDRDEANAR